MQAEVFKRKEARESRTKRSGGGLVDVQAVFLQDLMWIFMVSVLELVGPQGHTVS